MERIPELNVRSIDGIALHPAWRIMDWRDPTGEITRWLRDGVQYRELLRGFPKSIAREQWHLGNLPLNEGLNALFNLLCGATETAFNAANSYIGVGDSSTAAGATQTGLQASTNKLYKAMDSTYPTSGTLQKAIWRTTFTTEEANFDWNEITVASGNSDTSKNLNRKVQAMGVKTSALPRTAELTITAS